MSKSENEKFQNTGGSRFLLALLLLVGIGALLASFVGSFLDPRQFAFSWLFSFIVFYSLVIGSLFWVILHHAANAGWSVVVRRQMENVAGLFPYLILFFIPVVLSSKLIYHWMDAAANQHDPLWISKRPFLNDGFFWARAAFYFGFFTLATLLFKNFSTRQDETADVFLSVKMRKIALGFIPLFAFSLTFSAFDWLMSLDFHWFSTMWGVYLFAGSVWSSLALLILIVTALKSKGYLKVVNLEHYHVMGKLLLAFTIFWAYIAFSQYFLIWYANIPEETSFFFHHNSGSWRLYSIFIITIGHFFVPFLLLLTQWVKRKPALLCSICVWVLLMHVADIYWLVMPNLHREGVAVNWLDITTLIGIGATLGFLFLRSLWKHYLYPIHDPRLEESIHLKN